MALDGAQTAEIFEMLGLPRKTSAFGVIRMTHIVGPSGEGFDLAAIKTEVENAISALTADEETKFTEAGGILAEWDDVKNAHQRLFEDGGTKGVIFDAEVARERLRERTSNYLGLYVPKGGFMAEYKRFIARIRADSSGSIAR